MLDQRECLPDLWCDVLRVAVGATAGQRQIIFVAWLAVPDLPSEMAADQTPLCASSAYIETRAKGAVLHGRSPVPAKCAS